ncbi:protein-disulfide reductase DsbD domain-containing protein [Maribacter sp. 2304DJ31-5]|uniref:protein-disulfide reductase DsbD domain-containing protein n=1 Tax=Maribacter sp. 2304DJ31-5 TaxID=3386273 RepID=UPI0039BC592A
MKYIIATIIFLWTSVYVFSQTDDDPVFWEQELNQLSDTEYELILKGSIYKGWHMYSQYTAEGGSLPSKFTFKRVGADYELVGRNQESKTIKEYNDIFKLEETFFKERAIFKQRIKLLDPNVEQITVNLFYQVCKEICIPADINFVFILNTLP